MCGIAGIVDSLGRASHDLVREALIALERMGHRGARGSDDETGDGAGILTQMPHALLVDSCDFPLPPLGHYALGVLFLSQDEIIQKEQKRAFEAVVVSEDVELIGWRKVPVRSEQLGEEARRREPQIWHVIVGEASDKKLYRIRKKCSFVMSLSKETLVYKGLMLPSQLSGYYQDLEDPRFISAIALVHSRFSTNTLPAWELAHPFQYLCHNGEINALSGNLNWLAARQDEIKKILWEGKTDQNIPLIQSGRSDSAYLDEMLGILVLSGYELAEAMMLLIPEPWQFDALDAKTPERTQRQAFYRYFAPSFEPWDGPAAVCFSDGRYFGAALDRNGLRPCRYAITECGKVMVASEAGAFPFEEHSAVELGRLAPGDLLIVDTKTGKILNNQTIKDEVSTRKPYEAWNQLTRLQLSDLPERASQIRSSVPLVLRQRMFGFSVEDIEVILKPMALTGEEPVSSMGVDTPLAVLSDRPRSFFDYFVQNFAQVTNPPIDPLREKRVMSSLAFLGVRPKLGVMDRPDGVMLELAHPVLNEKDLSKIRRSGISSLIAIELNLSFSTSTGENSLRFRLNAIREEALNAARSGANIIILSDRAINSNVAPIPSLLGVAAVHQALVQAGLRSQTDLIVEAGDVKSVHDLACLLGYGATAVHPHLAIETLTALGFDEEQREHYIQALVKGMLKVMSKMGISVLQAYNGAELFEALGLSEEIVLPFFPATDSRIGGIGFSVVQKEIEKRQRSAIELNHHDGLEYAGLIHFRAQGERHRWNPESIHKLQEAARSNDFASYEAFAKAANGDSREPSAIRDLFSFKKSAQPLPLEMVEPSVNIVRRFNSGAMSLGAISVEAHQALAEALNQIGARSNSGEGGEDAARFGTLRNSKIKQVASGRFGVTAHYLVNAGEIQIKIAQGAKPGEGGQLPGGKVDEQIARLRHATPGVTLISPPPHHDIYSIEDLAQLIFDLRQVNPDARVSVKLVSCSGVGTIAAGVAKAAAHKIVISGDSGGTGAAALSSIRHAGVPWELGLAETHKALVENGLRSRVVLETDGQLRTGRDVVLAALLGADEFGFATAPLIALGCIMMRKCHLNICPVGIATQDPELRRKFKGEPEHVINYLFQVAEDVRRIMAELGFSTFDEMIGRRDRLERVAKTGHWKADFVSIDSMLEPTIETGVTEVNLRDQVLSRVDREIVFSLEKSIEIPQKFAFGVSNLDRAIGTHVSGYLAKRYGASGLAKHSVRIDLNGVAGQSLGAFLMAGVTISLRGLANDYVGKSLSGGVIAISSPLSGGPHLLVGNTSLYGATSGELYIAGAAGERFAVRNSGAKAVVEGVGDHGCEYMTGGTVIVLGKTGVNFAAGMSGGRAFVYDEDGKFRQRCNHALVSCMNIDPILSDGDELALILQMLQNHVRMTGSLLAQRLLHRGTEAFAAIVRVIPKEYERVMKRRVRNESVNQCETRP